LTDEGLELESVLAHPNLRNLSISAQGRQDCRGTLTFVNLKHSFQLSKSTWKPFSTPAVRSSRGLKREVSQVRNFRQAEHKPQYFSEVAPKQTDFSTWND